MQCNSVSSAKKLKLVGEILCNQELEEMENATLLMQELRSYSDDKTRVQESVDPISYWLEKQRLSSFASPLPIFACYYLTIPASSSFAESVFSYSGLSASKLRNAISCANLEREVFLKVNRRFVV